MHIEEIKKLLKMCRYSKGKSGRERHSYKEREREKREGFKWKKLHKRKRSLQTLEHLLNINRQTKQSKKVQNMTRNVVRNDGMKIRCDGSMVEQSV